MGVVEVVAPTDKIRERLDVIDLAVRQSAEVLRASENMRETERDLRATAALLSLTGKLLMARTAADAVLNAAVSCHEELGLPLAALMPDRSGSGWSVVASPGFTARKRAQLRRAFERVPARGRREAGMAELKFRFAGVVGAERAIAVAAGDAVLLVGPSLNGHRRFLTMAGSLLGQALARLEPVPLRLRRGGGMDMSLAWTAHELRGPLVEAGAALDRVLTTSVDADGWDVLKRTREELGQLAELVDPLLRWSAGASSLRKRRTDLVQIVRDAVASCSLGEANGGRIVVRAPAHVSVRADPLHLRGAISNVLRNALAYSPLAGPVRVMVTEDQEFARVSVRDRGPGIPVAERRSIFDPFTRGQAGWRTRPGTGLGLFIARQIVDAHRGAITVQSTRSGATFSILLPVATERKRACAS